MKTQIPILASLLLSSTAYAQTTEEWDGGYGAQAQRRSGFALGADLGAGIGNVDGYPKDAVKLNDPRYEADTELALGAIGRIWAGGAIRDWFTFGLGFEMSNLRGNGYTANGAAFLLRPELYPLWALGGAYRDLGVHADFGVGWMKMKDGTAKVADGGSLGRVGFGVFHETLRWHHLGVGPTVGLSHYFSETLTATVIEIGARVAFTVGP